MDRSRCQSNPFRYEFSPLSEEVCRKRGSLPGLFQLAAPLNRLVDQALKANPDLEAAKAALRQARENVYAAGGTLLPTVNANGSVTRQKNTGAQLGNPNNPGSIFTLYNASVSISYGIDLFGLARRNLESIKAQADFQRFQMEAAYLTLTSNVVTTAVLEASLRAQIAATQEIITSEAKQLDILHQQFAAGAAAKSDVLAQQTTLAQARASLPPLQKQLASLRNQLTALLGDFPSQTLGEAFRTCKSATAAGPAGHAALQARRTAARYPRGRGPAASGQRPGRRRHRQPAARNSP